MKTHQSLSSVPIVLALLAEHLKRLCAYVFKVDSHALLLSLTLFRREERAESVGTTFRVSDDSLACSGCIEIMPLS